MNMKKISAFLLTLTGFTLSFSVFAADGGHGGGSPAHRDNTTLFPQPKADPTKSALVVRPQLMSPSFNASLSGDSTVLKWTVVPGADVYHLQVATDPNFKWLTLDDHQVKASEFNLKGLEAGKKYYWRVAGWKNDNVAGANKGAFSSSVFEIK